MQKAKNQNTSMYIIFKLQKIKDKEKILQETRGKEHLTCRGTKLRMTSNFSETMNHESKRRME